MGTRATTATVAEADAVAVAGITPARVRLAPYRLTSPCADCPFRTDVRPYMRPERVDEIQAPLILAQFPCHKTVNYAAIQEDDNGEPVMERRNTAREAHCAGALILLEKLEEPSQMMRISERLGMYDRRKLDMAAPVYDSFDDMREAMENEQRRTTTRFARKRKRATD